MRQRFAKWMMAETGWDALNRLLSVLTLILLIVSMFVHGYAARILWSLAVLGLIVIYFRMLSRNVYRRQQENGAYLRQRYKVTSAWRGAVDRWHQRRDYRFFKCPSCRTRLRVPRGKGKINIVWPQMRHVLPAENLRRSQMFGYVIANLEGLTQAQKDRYKGCYWRPVPGAQAAARLFRPPDADV